MREVINRFYSKVDKAAPDKCWEWQGSRSPQGYGKLKMFGEQLAHRVSFKLNHGPLLKDMCVLHRCDNPPCVNPNHLFIGTRDVNNKDRATKKRNNHHNEGKTHCKRGHEFTSENTYYRTSGKRLCRKCNAEQSLRRYHEKRRGR